MNQYPLKMLLEHQLVKVLGRYEVDKPFHLNSTGSCLEFRVKGSELWLNIEVDFEFFEPWIDILIDGAVYQHRILTKEDRHICLFRRLDPNRTKHVRILRSTQMMPEDPSLSISAISLESDAERIEFEVIPEGKIKLEFIGDSITSGEGCMGNGALQEWISMCFSHTNSYPYLVGEALSADVQVFSQSGWGLYCSYDGDYKKTIPTIYHQVSSVNETHWKFSSYQPDVIVINLGTNDYNRIQPATLKEEHPDFTEEECFAFETDYRHQIAAAAKDFLTKIHEANPKAKIIWAYGMLGNQLEEEIQSGIDSFSESVPDTAHYLKLTDTTEEECGSRMHPGIISHKRAAEDIIHKINTILV